MEDYIVDTSPATPTWMYVAFAVAVIIVIMMLIWGLFKLRKLITRPEMYGMTREEMAKRWVQIRTMSKQQGLMGAKLALLEADTLLDSGLKSLSMPGDTLGERLKVAGYKYPKLQSVWWAHKLRNQLAHDASSQISQRQIEQALNEFERALKVLNVM